jgi:hypothetical protein
MSKLFFSFLALVAVVMIQVSFLSTWSMPVKAFNLTVSLVLFLTIIGYYRQALWWAFGAGVLLELFSFGLFGLAVVSLLLTVIFAHFLAVHIFTNRSVYSLIGIGISGSFFYNVLILVGTWSMTLLLPNPWYRAVDAYGLSFMLWQVGLNTLILLIIFFVYTRLQKPSPLDFSQFGPPYHG